METIIVCPMIYVLELEDDCYYVGITMDLNKRYAQHLSGSGAKWTRLHKPKRIIEVIVENATIALETEIAEKYIRDFGRNKVCGGKYTAIPN
jgi:predicted GIY-YIG superfamily endonuclease